MTSPLPKHVAIIMDGNGRWAQQRFRPRVIGHRAGARAVNDCIDFCIERGIAALTLFAFSSENWGRPSQEVDALMKLFMGALEREVAAGRLDPEAIDETLLGAHTALSDLPAPDLFIRTGGDVRISNFLLWQLAYTELWFTQALWPDFDQALFQQALDAYAQRERRYGLTSAQIAASQPETTAP